MVKLKHLKAKNYHFGKLDDDISVRKGKKKQRKKNDASFALAISKSLNQGQGGYP